MGTLAIHGHPYRHNTFNTHQTSCMAPRSLSALGTAQGIVRPQRTTDAEPRSPAVSPGILDPSPASATGATPRAARPPRCSCLPSPFASTRSAEGEPGTQVGLLEQGYAAAQVARGVAERAAVPRNGKREARDASRSTSRSSWARPRTSGSSCCGATWAAKLRQGWFLTIPEAPVAVVGRDGATYERVHRRNSNIPRA